MSESQQRHNDDRMRRAKSWYEHSLHAQCDDDKFIFLWIAFNAAYGRALLDPNVHRDSGSAEQEWERQKGFLRNLLYKDTRQLIRDVLWGCDLLDRRGDGSLHGSVPRLLHNHYVYCFFWYYVHNRVEDYWRTGFSSANDLSTEYLRKRKPSVTPPEVRHVLEEVFSRLYTLRNQMFHGGTTCGTGKGRGQLVDATKVMKNLVPAMLTILQADLTAEDSTDYWGTVAYPHVDEKGRLIDENEATAN